ncbi:hypothetical protein [Nannocystis pusilla]|uniref:hypothetical protein n=1 Tax=Nannocystis pusilla TaxID=889268 RepID=UPI003B817240
MVWRAGEYRLREAVPHLIRLIGSGDVMLDYCIAWALARCGDADTFTALARARNEPGLQPSSLDEALKLFIPRAGKSDMVMRMTLEMLRGWSDELRDAVAARRAPPCRRRSRNLLHGPPGLMGPARAIRRRSPRCCWPRWPPATPPRSRTSTASTTRPCARACSPACARSRCRSAASATSATCSRWPRSAATPKCSASSLTASRRPRRPSARAATCSSAAAAGPTSPRS